ncbi:MAG: efflux RND transporter periplasmic adaptor subunit [Planctomycetaceae bacterium]|jgi:multidrug efflux pump subunit AcrA (membrane-fusion protein)|nr:efflux RND transporter periplasmic adaptor subunit [Planctomycetaceae bacterium]
MKRKPLIILLIAVFLLLVPVICYSYRYGVEVPAWLKPFWRQSAAMDSHEKEESHDHAKTSASHSHTGEVTLSHQALRNIGITDAAIRTVSPGDFRIMASYPGIVVTRPGRSEIEISAPASGTIVRIYYEPGQILPPNAPLFDIDLSNEEFVAIQAELILMYRKLAIIEGELKRLKPLSEDISPKSYRDNIFQKLELETSITLSRKKLLLYGLTDAILDEELQKNGRIIRVLTICVPEVTEERIVPCIMISGGKVPDLRDISGRGASGPLQLVTLSVEKGMRVTVGSTLAVIADYSRLFIQGRAFDYDEGIIAENTDGKHPLEAVFEGHGGKQTVSNLPLRYIESQIDEQTRTLSFYVDLENRHTGERPSGFIDWKFKPGQRCELRIPSGTISDCFTLPRTAVAVEGAETSVFVYVHDEDGKKVWQKQPIHVLHQDREFVAIANDNSLKPGSRVAVEGASQLLVALNAASGGAAPDAHAGHSH